MRRVQERLEREPRVGLNSGVDGPAGSGSPRNVSAPLEKSVAPLKLPITQRSCAGKSVVKVSAAQPCRNETWKPLAHAS